MWSFTWGIGDVIVAIVEIAILFVVIYGVLRYLRGTRSSLILAGGAIAFFVLKFCIEEMKLNVIDELLRQLGSSFLLILIIVFQPELRRLLAQLGSLAVFQGKRRREVIGEVVAAAQNMAKRKCGALIVLERRIHLQWLINDSVPLDSRLSSVLLESIFYPNSPLHDGAVIIRDDRIVAARAILPLTRADNISTRIGTRHRAALGISEECDAITVVVSEETGSISLTKEGVFYRDLTPEALTRLLEKLVVQPDKEELRDVELLNRDAGEEKEQI